MQNANRNLSDNHIYLLELYSIDIDFPFLYIYIERRSLWNDSKEQPGYKHDCDYPKRSVIL